MNGSTGKGDPSGRVPDSDAQHLEWLVHVAQGAALDAGGTSSAFLGDYLSMLAEAATSGRFPDRDQMRAVHAQGRRAAESGVSVGRGVDLYLSAARRVWDELPAVVRERDNKAVRAAAKAVLVVVDDAVASFAEGHAEAGREMIRREETQRRELVEDLLRGGADLSQLVERAEPFGLDLTRAHQVALARPGMHLSSIATTTSALERAVLDRFGDRDVLVATKDGAVVVLALADAISAPPTASRTSDAGDLGRIVHNELGRLKHGSPWRVAVGRPYLGAYGIARSYEEAREGLVMALRMHVDDPIVEIKDLLTYRVLSRDQPALIDLVHSVLGPLQKARGGAAPLVETLTAYFESGCVATSAGRRLHLSVRAVTYRLDRVHSLTGFDPSNPAHRFTLQAAVLGARLLEWPEHSVPGATS